MTVREFVSKLDDSMYEHVIIVRDRYGSKVAKFEPEYMNGIRDDILDRDIGHFYAEKWVEDRLEFVVILAGLPFEDDEDAD